MYTITVCEIVVLWLCFALRCRAFELPEIEFQLLSPLDLQISIPDAPGVELFAFHANVNTPLKGVTAGEINVDVRERTDGRWIFKPANLQLKDGDVLHYWYYVQANGKGYQKIEQTWVVSSESTDTDIPTTAPAPSTTSATTPQSTPTSDKPATLDTSSGSRPSGDAIVFPTEAPANIQNAGANCFPKHCAKSLTTVNGQPVCQNQLLFEDNFDFLDFEKWQHEINLAGGGNWEFQMYYNNRSNSYVRDSTLFVKPSLLSDQYGEDFLASGNLDINGGSPADECTNPLFYGCIRTGTAQNILNPIKSARLRSVNSFSFKFGKVEIRAKMPTGDWIWPAFWMMPKRNAYSTWPCSGEVDIFESRGNANLVQNGVNIGTEQIGSTLHYGPFWPLNGYEKAHGVKNSAPGNGYDKDFHTYVFDWTPDYLRFTLDDEEYLTVTPPDGGFWELGGFNGIAGIDNPWKYGTKMAPFDQEFYLLINVAVGGVSGYFPDDAKNPSTKPWLNPSHTASTDFWKARNDWHPTWNADVNNGEDAALQVDYIKVWSL